MHDPAVFDPYGTGNAAYYAAVAKMPPAKLTNLLDLFSEGFCCEQPYDPEWVWLPNGNEAYWFYGHTDYVCAVWWDEESEEWDFCGMHGPLTREQCALREENEDWGGG